MRDLLRRRWRVRAVAGALILGASLGSRSAKALAERNVFAEQDGGARPVAGAGVLVHITSPLGRTGLGGTVRIVAQVHTPAGVSVGVVRFFVNGELVGSASQGPPFAVDWRDENPFERCEIVAEAEDAAGRATRDTVVLPAYEVSDRTEVTSVLLEVGVYDKTGRFVSRLEPSAFHVRENGVDQQLDLVAREAVPATLVLLVDNSQSMSQRMEFVQQAAGRLAETLKPADKVVVAPFNGHIQSITGPTADRATIVGAIDAMHAGGGTAIFDSLLESVHALDGIDGRRAVVLITDGYDENSTVDADTVLQAAEAAHVTVYVVGIGGVAGISLRGELVLRRLADATGGRVFFPPRGSDLVAVSDAVSVDAHNRYLITYTPRNQQMDGTWRAVSVDVADGYRVRTRAGYFAPKPIPIRPTLEFTVTTAARAYVDVTADDLEVVEDDVAQSIDTFQEAVDPVSIVMALDASGSMKKSAETVRQAARDFVLSVRPEDKLALITFADKPMFAHVLATERDWSLEAIDKYEPLGGTALYDALWNSVMHLKDVPGRHAVVVLTDGRDENNPGTAPGSEHTLDEVMDLNRTVGAAVFAIGLGTKVDRDVLLRLAQESGGETYFSTDGSMLAEQYRRIIAGLRRRYVLSYTSMNSNHDGGWRKVVIKAKARDLIVTSTGGYFAPPQ